MPRVAYSRTQAPVGFILKDAMREFTFDNRETYAISAVGSFSMAGVDVFVHPDISDATQHIHNLT